jgi:molybdenum cofactor cytidylyltransferase
MTQSSTLPGVVLAAGQGTRFSAGYKLLVPLRDHSIIYRTLKAMLDSRLEPVLLVVGFEHENVLKAVDELRDHPKLQIVPNDQWWTGQASSVRAAIEHLPKDAPGVLFLPGDMPLMTSALIDRVAQRCFQSHRLCFPVYQGQKGHPTAFPSGLFSLLAELEGDGGGLSLAREYWDEAEKVELPMGEEFTQLDLDTEADYAHLMALETISDG